jgi:type II secretory pathway component PulC
MPRLLVWVPVCFFVAACGGAQSESAMVEETALIAGPSADAEQSAGSGADQSDTAQRTPGTIRRVELTQILALGPGAVLAMVETEPFRKDGKFVGFKIARFVHGTPAAIDLRDGDVLTAVNGLRIVSPDDFFRVFQELQVASEIRFDVLRDGAPLTLTYPVTE